MCECVSTLNVHMPLNLKYTFKELFWSLKVKQDKIILSNSNNHLLVVPGTTTLCGFLKWKFFVPGKY